MLVLSLFPGVDLLGLAFKREGFCVVQGGDVIFGGDIREEHYPPGRFDGVIGGPPCQFFSRLSHMVKHNGLQPKFGNLIPEFERVVKESLPQWFLMEQVPDAPAARVAGYSTHVFTLNNRQCLDERTGEAAAQHRVRKFTFGVCGNFSIPLMVETAVFESANFEYAAIGGSNHGKRKIRTGGNGKTTTTMPFNSKSQASLLEICRKQGIPENAFDDMPFTVEGKCKAAANGVPLPMGRAIARAVKEAVSQ